ncbi:MAG: sigma 54-interacting transcriptional regulator [Deltaproteobacteria bacterium]
MDSNARPDPVVPYKKRLSTLQEFYEDKFRKTKSEWEKYVAGQTDIDISVIPQDILSSWQRCRNAGLNPFKKPTPPILSSSEMQSLLEENRQMIQAGMPLMNNFKNFVGAAQFLVCLFTRQGCILEVRVDDEYKKLAQSTRLVPGALWAEETVGTNSFSLALTIKKPMQCFGPQHYMRTYHGETASSAPIFNPRGELIGGIALVSNYNGTNPQTLVLAISLAQAIESSMKTKEALETAQIAGSYQQAVLSAIPEAMVAFDLGGLVTMINENALKILQANGPVEGRHVRDILKADNVDLFNIVESNDLVTDSEVRIVSRLTDNPYQASSSPIYGSDGAVIGKIIILSEAKRNRKPAPKMIGAKANFHLKDICGLNSRFIRTVQHVQMAASSDSNVLLLGESGTGKDIFAQAIHNAGSRRNGPYVAINCASIPRDLIASELFGHAEGAFTGARRGGNTGKFELADGGTIFFDEIAETSLEFQAVLLRVVEEKAIVRVGGTSVRPVDVRIVAATNKNIMEEIKKGAFRSDLYYRLNVFTIETLPLRDRKDDIPLLIDNFIRKYGSTMDKKFIRIHDHVVKILENYPWPGNIRELQNVIERMINVAQGQELTIDLVPDEILHWQYKDENKADNSSVKKREKETIMRMMKMDIPRNKIAEKLNMARSTFYRKLKEYSLDDAPVDPKSNKQRP